MLICDTKTFPRALMYMMSLDSCGETFPPVLLLFPAPLPVLDWRFGLLVLYDSVVCWWHYACLREVCNCTGT